MSRPLHAILVASLLASTLAGCAGSSKKLVTAPKTTLLPPAEVPTTPPAGLSWASRRAERHFVKGIEAYESGRPDEAREEFALALRAFDAPGVDVQDDEKARDAYQTLLKRVSQYDVDALAARITEETPLEMLSEVEFSLERPNSEAERELRKAMESVRFDLPVQVNDEVLSFVNYFRSRNRGFVSSGLFRSGRYIDMMRRIFKEEGLPQDLVYMALIESSFKPTALSKAKAKGIWQFIPETGRRYGLAQTSWIDERSDPEKSTRAAARYLKDLYGMFGDWYLAMAAYNCGEMRIVRELEKAGVVDGERVDYWELVRRQRIPKETRSYVPAIIAGMIIGKNPVAFGISDEVETPLRHDSVVLPVATNLRVLAQRIQTSVDYLRELNPELRKGNTPPAPYALRVPPGRGATLLTEVLSLTPEERGGSVTYVIRKGDTLSTIARAHGLGVAELAEWNDIGSKTKLRVGAVLQVPTRGGASSGGTAIAASSSAPAPTKVASTSPTLGASESGRKVTYKVRRGDTLYQIARRYNVSIERLSTWNRSVVAGGDIHPGDVLTIYVR